MRIRCLVCLLLLVVGVSDTSSAQPLPGAKPEAVGLSSERLARIGQALQRDIDGGRLPGAVVAIARKGKLVYFEAFGFRDKAAGEPMRKDAIFNINSMTKPLVAVGALTLVEEDLLLLNDPVGKYLPALAKMKVAVLRSGGSGEPTVEIEPARRAPTIQDLMRHTAGITNGSEANTVSRLYIGLPGERSGAEFIEKLGTIPLQYQPGTKWGYSLGFDVLGVVIENVTRKTLGQHLSERVFTPLGMVDTAFQLSTINAKRHAKPLPTDPDTGNAQSVRDPQLPRKLECGGGCAYSTTSDYLRFAQMLLNRGTLDGTRLLGRKTVEHMAADQIGPEVDVEALRNYPNINGYGFGLGVAVRRGTGVAGIMGSPGDFHWGGAGGTYFWVDPKEELAVVFMAATPGAARLHYRQTITSLVLQAIVD